MNFKGKVDGSLMDLEIFFQFLPMMQKNIDTKKYEEYNKKKIVGKADESL